jgi:asparaginyl-tRNA synthetase
MRWVHIDELSRNVGRQVEIKGWVYNLRSSGKIKFLLLRDGTGFVQCVITENDSVELAGIFDQLTQESSCIVRGKVREDMRAPGGYELIASDIELVHRAEPYPITPKEHGVAFLMDHRHLWLRSSKQNAILRIRAEVIKAARDYLDEQGFMQVDAPIITPSASEGTTTLFEADYFGSRVYLTQSGQLYNEASCMALGKVYCYGPTFRAEKAKTRRHLTEFWMLEPEIAFGDLDTVFELAEGLVTYVVHRVLGRREKELNTLERDRSRLEKVSPPFVKITYDEALSVLKKKGHDVAWGADLGAAEETVLSQSFDGPVFIHRYPAEAKAFYMQPDPENEDLALCTDMLAPEGYGEIIGGSERIYDLSLLEERLEKNGLPRKVFEWYLDLRRYGSVPHAGFGLGIERTVAWLCGIKHVREAIPFPRMLNRVYP